MDTGKHDIVDKPYLSTGFSAAEEQLGQLLRDAPIPVSELAENSALFVSPRTIKRQFFFDELYKLALPVHGIAMQFGVRWGRDLATLHALRTIYEPYNASRIIVGFDTFEGFPGVDARDGVSSQSHKGTLNVGKGYENFLQEVFDQRRALDPLPQVARFEVHKGDASELLARYLEAHPETIVALAHFDMDLYEPTRRCLELLQPHLTRGSVLAFDELQSFVFPGETVAVREVFGLGRIRLQRSPQYSGHGSYFIVE